MTAGALVHSDSVSAITVHMETLAQGTNHDLNQHGGHRAGTCAF